MSPVECADLRREYPPARWSSIDAANAADIQANAKRYAAAIKALDEPLRSVCRAIPQGARWLVTSEGAFSYLARDYGLKELYLWPINADAIGHAAADPADDRYHAAREYSGDLFRKHGVGPAGTPGRQGDGRAVRRRAVRRFAEPARWSRADLSEAAWSYGRHDRERLRCVMAERMESKVASGHGGASASARSIAVGLEARGR